MNEDAYQKPTDALQEQKGIPLRNYGGGWTSQVASSN
jgi:hypothetical protein